MGFPRLAPPANILAGRTVFVVQNEMVVMPGGVAGNGLALPQYSLVRDQGRSVSCRGGKFGFEAGNCFIEIDGTNFPAFLASSLIPLLNICFS